MDHNSSEIQNTEKDASQFHVETAVYSGPTGRSTGEGFEWIVGGFKLFKQDVGAWIITMIVGFLVALVFNLIPIVGSIVSMLLTYIWVGGLMLGCQAAHEGRPFELKYLFAGFSYQAGRLIGLSVITSVASIVVMFMIMGPMYIDLLSGNPPLEPTPQYWLSMLMGVALMIPIMMAVWFAPMLIVLQDMPVWDAMKASFMGCYKNVLPFLVYGVVSLVLYIIGALPLLLGLLVVVPVILGSMYTAYRSVYLTEVDS